MKHRKVTIGFFHGLFTWMWQRKMLCVVGIFSFVAIFLFKDFIFYGRPPFPGNFLLAWYEPWKSLHFANDTILQAHKPVAEDVFRHILPFRLLGIDLLKQLELPLWNPYNGSGQPLLATLNSGFFDPFNILFVIFSPGYANGIYVVLQFMMIAIAMCLYIRSLQLSYATSIFSGLIFALSGFVTVRLVFTNYGAALALLPLMFAIIEYVRSTKRPQILFGIPVLIAVMVVSTQTQIVIYILGILVLYGWLRLWNMYADRLMRLRILGLFSLLMILGVSFVSFQLLPTYELMRLSHIRPGESLDIIGKFLVPVEHLLSIPIPNYFGSTAIYNYWGHGDSIETAAYLGILPVLLMLLSFGYRKKSLRSVCIFFLILLAVSVTFAIDWWGSRALYALPIPILSTGAPARIFMITTFALTILSAFGFERMYTSKKISLSFILISIGVIIAACLLLAYTYIQYTSGLACPMFTPDNCRLTALRNTILAIGIFVPQLFLLLLIPMHQNKYRLHGFLVFLLFLSVMVMGVYNAQKFLPTAPSVDVFPKLPIIEALQAETVDARVFGIGDAMLAANLATQFRIYDPQYYHPLYIYRYRELIEYANNGKYIARYPRGDASIKDYYRVDQALIQRRDRLLNLDSVKYRLFKKDELRNDRPSGDLLWEDDAWLLVSSESALPRAYIATSVMVESSPSDILAALFDPAFDYHHRVVLEEPVPLSRTIETDDSAGIAEVMQYGAHRVDIKATIPQEAVLVLTDNYYPGWEAYVDNEHVPILRANYTFRAVTVPAGEHLVSFRYRPKSVRYGAVVSGLASALLWFLYRKRHTLLL